MKELIRRFLPRNRFARSVSILAGGTAAGQIIVVVASPILTRLYSPEDFGVLAVFAGLLAILGVVASLRYQLAIPLPESDEDAANVTVLSLLVVAFMAALATLIIWLWGDSFATLLNVPTLSPHLWLLPVGLLLTGTYQVFNYWAIRTKAFPEIARTKLTQALSMVGVQLGAYTLGPLSLILGQVFGQAAGTTSLGVLTVRQKLPTFRRVRVSSIRTAAIRYRHFPIYSTWGGFFNSSSTQLPTILFASLFSPAAAGIYMLSHRVLAMPMQLLGRAIGDIFLSTAPTAYRNGDLKSLVAKTHSVLANIAMPPLLVLVIAGPDLFSIVFGEEWRMAGEFARWMAPWLYLQFITSPLSLLFVTLEKQKHELILQAVLLASRIAALLGAAYLGDLKVAVVAFAMTSAACYLLVLIWEMKLTGNGWKAVFAPTTRALIVSIFLVIPIAIAQLFLFNPVFWLVGLGLTAGLIMARYIALGRVAWRVQAE